MKTKKIGARSKERAAATFLKTDQARRRIGELAENSSHPIAIGMREDKPAYMLEPAAAVSAERLAIAVAIKPDEARKNFAEIRALLRLEEGMEFAIAVDGRIAALLRRHPNYVPEAATRYRATRRKLVDQQILPSLGEEIRNLRLGQDRVIALLETLVAKRVKQTPSRNAGHVTPGPSGADR